MKTGVRIARSFFRNTILFVIAIALAVSVLPVAAQTTVNPLNFTNNYLVTGDYVVAGWQRSTTIAASHAGYAYGTISVPDTFQQQSLAKAPSPNVTFRVPDGADVVAAVLYWQTVEKSSSNSAGALAYFNGYPVSAGKPLGNQPPTWSSGGCSGPSNGTNMVQTYRADVRPYLPITNGIIQPNGAFNVEFADSGSNGSTAPFTLGATLVIVYRVLSPDYPMNAIIIYDGGFAPNNTAPNVLQNMWGFYQPAKNPVAKLTHIVGNGQANKLETVSFNGTANVLNSLYNLGTSKGNPPFPGLYGDWDNPTWDVTNYVGSPQGNPATVSTEVDSGSTNSGCVTWGAIVFSTTVDQSDKDGLLDVWKANRGYCAAGAHPDGTCPLNTSDPGWVDLTGATPGQQDVFIQADTMCHAVSDPNGIGICKIGSPGCTCTASYGPPAGVTDKITSAFANHHINLHWMPGNYIQAPVCNDKDLPSPQLCMYPSQEGAVPWKAGLVAIKNQPIDSVNESETDCETAPNGSCHRVFQPGKKDSYHYLLFANRLGAPRWSFGAGTLTSAVWNTDNTVAFTTTTPVPDPNSAIGYDRVTIAGALNLPGMNGTYKTTPGTNSFSINLADNPNPPTAPSTPITYTAITDPNLAVYTGNAGTGSGMSDIGGSDSIITLGGWGSLATFNAFAGTTMHEFGHTLGLTHGGYSYPNYAFKTNYVPVSDPNCKPNFQSIMSYLFQVDLLYGGSDGSRVLDFSAPSLSALSEISGGAGLDPNAAYAATKWFALSRFNGTGDPATRHCDGSPKGASPDMFETEGLNAQFTWTANQDVNYDGVATRLNGFSDWNQDGLRNIGYMDLRQIGATGSSSSASGYNLGIGGGYNLGIGGGYNLGIGGGYNLGIGGGYNLGIGGGYNLGIGGGYNLGIGGGYNLGIGGGYNLGIGGGEDRGEVNSDIANSYVRQPRFLTTSLTGNLGTQVSLSWMVPTFGNIDHYNVYRQTSPGTSFQLQSPFPITSNGSMLTATDPTSVGCTMYTYFVTAVILDPNAPNKQRESIASNRQTITTNCNFLGFGSPLQPAGSLSYSGTSSFGKVLTFTWQLQDPVSLSLRSDLNLNTVLANYAGPVPSSGKCPVPSAANILSTQVLYSPGGTPTLGTLTYDPKKMNFVYNWNTSSAPKAGCYVLEVDVSYGQVPGSPAFKAYQTTVQLK
jgi:hypothetical protein